MIKQWLTIVILFPFFLAQANAETSIFPPSKKGSTAFAIVIDTETFQKAEAAVIKYRDAVESDGLAAYIVADNWETPDQVREEILKLYAKSPKLEGVVLIGEIPVAMIRDAQHMTSAFKIDQQNARYSMLKTSVPSDRFYDDFDLKFEYIGQDSSNKLLHYYSLKPDSPQRVDSDIYSGRIKAPVNDDTKFEIIARYLNRVADQKKENDIIDQAMVFAGHGYHSESLDSWSSNLLSLREQFPDLFTPGNNLKYYFHSMSRGLKDVILREMQNPDLDLAIFHAHGADDTQYLLGLEPSESINQNVEAIKLFLRSKLRQAKNRGQSVEEAQEYYREKYGIPLPWFEGVFVDSVILADSVMSARMDIYSTDIEKINPGAKLIVFDECFNGAFINSGYISGKYVFGNGKTVAGVANSVNVLQDLWADELIGLLSQGVRLGYWQKTKNYLESHIIGDPTFHFSDVSDKKLNRLLVENENNIKFWNKLRKSDQIPLRNLAVAKLFKLEGASFEQDLIEIYNTDPSFNVRMEALKCLAVLRTDKFEEIMFKSVNDPAEFIRRVSVTWMGDIGRSSYLPVLLEKLITDPSKRVRFNAKSAIEKINPEEAITVWESIAKSMPQTESSEASFQLVSNSLKYTVKRLNEELITEIKDDELKLKKRLTAARTFRNYRFHQAIPEMIDVIKDPRSPIELRVTLLEALGWFGYSQDRQNIVNFCGKIISDAEAQEELKIMALRTKNRITEGANNPVTP
ncbi:MAG: HEAT repeat domain-containing protein [Calditrichaceae bacterium]